MNIFFLFAVSGCVSISVFASSLGIHIGITSTAIGLKIVQSKCTITSGIKNYKLIIKEKKQKSMII